MDRPRIVTVDDEAGRVDRLRGRGVAVESIRFAPLLEWKKKACGKALGANDTVNAGAVLASAAQVFREGRIEGGEPSFDRLLDRLRSGLPPVATNGPAVRVSAALLALALPLWFREVVPYRRSYRAG